MNMLKQKISSRERLILFCLILSLIFLAFLPASLAEASYKNPNVPFSVEMKIGFDYQIKENGNVPAFIVFTNVREDWNGTIEMILPAEDMDEILFEKSVALAKGEDLTIHECIPIIRNADKIQIEIRDENDELQYSYLEEITSNEDVTVLTLFGEEKNEFEKMDGELIYPELGKKIHIAQMDDTNFPVTVSEMDMVDLVCTTETDIMSLSVRLQNALHMWIRKGGALLIVGNSLSFQYSEEDDYIEEENGSDFRRVSYGKGSISFMREDETEIPDVMKKSIGYDDQNKPKLYSEKGFLKNEWCVDALFDLGRFGTNVPDLYRYIIVIVIYLFAALPCLFFYLKKKKKQYYLREAIAILAIVFSSLIFILGSGTRLWMPTAHAIHITDISTSKISDSIFVSAQVPYRQDIEMTLEKDYDISFFFLNRSHLNYTGNLVSAGQKYEYEYQDKEGERILRMGNTDAVAPIYYQQTRTMENDEQIGIWMYEEKDSDGKQVFVNKSGFDYQVSMIVKNGRVSLIHAFDSENRSENEKLSLMDEDSFRKILEENQIMYQSAADTIENYLIPGLAESDKTWFIGIVSEDEAGDSKEKKDWDRTEVHLVISELEEQEER